MRSLLAILVLVAGCQFAPATSSTDRSESLADAASISPISDADVAGADGAPQSTDSGPPNNVCPAVCDSCDSQGNCIIDCTTGTKCPGPIACPIDRPCYVDCRGSDACAGGVTCSGEACRVECQANSCDGPIDCSGSCACDVRCAGDGSGSCDDIAASCPVGADCSEDSGCESDECSSATCDAVSFSN